MSTGTWFASSEMNALEFKLNKEKGEKTNQLLPTSNLNHANSWPQLSSVDSPAHSADSLSWHLWAGSGRDTGNETRKVSWACTVRGQGFTGFLTPKPKGTSLASYGGQRSFSHITPLFSRVRQTLLEKAELIDQKWIGSLQAEKPCGSAARGAGASEVQVQVLCGYGAL